MNCDQGFCRSARDSILEHNVWSWVKLSSRLKFWSGWEIGRKDVEPLLSTQHQTRHILFQSSQLPFLFSGNLNLREVKVTHVVTLLVTGRCSFQKLVLFDPIAHALSLRDVIYTVAIMTQSFILETFANRRPLKVIESGSQIIRTKIQKDSFRPENSF